MKNQVFTTLPSSNSTPSLRKQAWSISVECVKFPCLVRGEVKQCRSLLFALTRWPSTMMHGQVLLKCIQSKATALVSQKIAAFLLYTI